MMTVSTNAAHNRHAGFQISKTVWCFLTLPVVLNLQFMQLLVSMLFCHTYTISSILTMFRKEYFSIFPSQMIG
jgi:hypothetical protein